ncbi:hypothetical protein AUJ64_03210 [Candidatus Pacearchaeota archaeon CG1_02_39_14]|nr:MAG: hypothetical protein AUJ64_03210 [Candidatus Pacearchaeota archaeon CG1_02_39_14]
MVTDILTETYAQLGIPVWLLLIAVAWSLVWKGLALWKSARINQPVWFVILLVVNTLGILEILYIFLFSQIKLPEVKEKGKKKKKAGPKRKK